MAKASLGANLQVLRGTIGGEIFTRGLGGTTVRAPAQYKFKLTPAMANSADNFKLATAYKNELTRLQMEAWNAFARTQTRHNTVSGQRYTPTGHNLYIGLTCKFLQINPGVAPPTNPPAGPFAGDAITVTAQVASGFFTFHASGANVAPSQTELLAQKLASHLRQPTDKFVSQGFVSFTGAGSGFHLDLPPGFYVPAYRFVQSETGQMSELIALPVVDFS